MVSQQFPKLLFQVRVLASLQFSLKRVIILLMFSESKEQEKRLIATTRKHFVKTFAKGNPSHQLFPYHVEQVEKWANRILGYYPEASREVVLLSVWLHDIGQAEKGHRDTHEIHSEQEARKFLPTLGLPQEEIDMVAHCVRTHRCKPGALPETTEAKIVAAADSASHLTDICYVLMLNQGKTKEEVSQKLDRDIRDIQSLPEPLLKQLTPLHTAWKEVIASFPE